MRSSSFPPAERSTPPADGASRPPRDDAVGIGVLLGERSFVRRLARALTRTREDADDLEQEVWLRAMQYPPARPSSMRAWLARVARSQAIDASRARARRARDARAPLPESPPAPPELLSERQERRFLAEALERLDQRYSETLRLRFLEGLPPRRIAALQSVPVETVYTRLKRGLAALRRCLESERGGRTSRTLAAPSHAGARSGRRGASLAASTMRVAAVSAAVVTGLAVSGTGTGTPRERVVHLASEITRA